MEPYDILEEALQDAIVAMEKYEVFEQRGQGVYGTVSRARNRESGETVAIKKIQILEDEAIHGVPPHVIREVTLLQGLEHPNIVRFLEIIHLGCADFNLIFEYLDGDLHGFIKEFREAGELMPLEQHKTLSKELLSGIHYCHALLIIHRDLKPQNVLIRQLDNGVQVKICDFGLARAFSFPLRAYSRDVITLWYRAPEILLGCEQYGPEVDVWSGACVIAEMATNTAVFTGDSEIGTLLKIFRLLGTPTEETWPGCSRLDFYTSEFPRWPSTLELEPFAARRPELRAGEHSCLDLLRQLLRPCPAQRLSARKAKQHGYFNTYANV